MGVVVVVVKAVVLVVSVAVVIKMVVIVAQLTFKQPTKSAVSVVICSFLNVLKYIDVV